MSSTGAPTPLHSPVLVKGAICQARVTWLTHGFGNKKSQKKKKRKEINWFPAIRRLDATSSFPTAVLSLAEQCFAINVLICFVRLCVCFWSWFYWKLRHMWLQFCVWLPNLWVMLAQASWKPNSKWLHGLIFYPANMMKANNNQLHSSRDLLQGFLLWKEMCPIACCRRRLLGKKDLFWNTLFYPLLFNFSLFFCSLLFLTDDLFNRHVLSSFGAIYEKENKMAFLLFVFFFF